MIPRIITDTTVTIHLDNEILIANKSHPRFAQIREAALKQDWNQIKDLIDIGQAIERWSNGEFQILDNTVTYRGDRIPDVLERRILGFFEEQAPFKHLLEFYRRLAQNPSHRSVQELYGFLEHDNIPIGEDGCFYAYKSVRPTLMDWHSNSCHNGIGELLEMPRNTVDDDANRGCSKGYHVGSLEYASTFGGANAKLLIVRVDPADVVSVPHDCAHQKVRTCRYTVIQEYKGPLPDTYWTPGHIDDGIFDEDLEDSSDIIEELEDRIERLNEAISAAEDAEIEVEIIDNIKRMRDEVEDELYALR